MNLYLRMLMLWLRPSRPKTLSIWDCAVTKLRVIPTDLDFNGHMNNGKYLSLMDIGRIDLMKRSGFWGKALKLGWYPVVAGQFITYRRSLKPWQGFQLHTRALGLDQEWIYIEQTFLSKGTLYAQAVVKARFLKRSGGSVTMAEIIEMTGEVPAELVIPDWVKDWSTHSTLAMKQADQR